LILLPDIKKKRLEWIRHLIRMDRGRVVGRHLGLNQREGMNEKTKTEMVVMLKRIFGRW
jgi:hypothetical protein